MVSAQANAAAFDVGCLAAALVETPCPGWKAAGPVGTAARAPHLQAEKAADTVVLAGMYSSRSWAVTAAQVADDAEAEAWRLKAVEAVGSTGRAAESRHYQ